MTGVAMVWTSVSGFFAQPNNTQTLFELQENLTCGNTFFWMLAGGDFRSVECGNAV